MRLDQGNSPQNSLVTAGAQRLGINGETMSRYITGRQFPTLPTVRKIEELFGWPIDAQVRLIAGRDLGYGTVLGEVLRENFPDIEPDFSYTAFVRTKEPRYRPTQGGWSHAMVGKRLGCQAVSVTRWLNAKRYPELRTMLRIQRIFDWPVTDQVVLVPEEGYNDRWSTAFKAVLDERFPLKEGVTKITSKDV